MLHTAFMFPALVVTAMFYIFVIWVLWMIVKSLKGIDQSLREIAAKSANQP